MNADNILYCLQTISSFEPDDIECDDFEIAVNDDQFAQMSIVKATGLGVELIDKLTEQNEQLIEFASSLQLSVCDESRLEKILIEVMI
jgi:hypothetical protein